MSSELRSQSLSCVVCRLNMAKMDPNEIKIIIVRVPGGEVPPVPALAPKVGPMKLVTPLTQFD